MAIIVGFLKEFLWIKKKEVRMKETFAPLTAEPHQCHLNMGKAIFFLLELRCLLPHQVYEELIRNSNP